MILATVRDELSAISRGLDAVEGTPQQVEVPRELVAASEASAEAVADFRRDDDLASTLGSVRDAASRFEDAVRDTLEGPMLFHAFLQGERRLFIDLGLDSGGAQPVV